ncbi:MAG: Hsp20/alpha crystallin family protein [Anaerolineaceae bacterium]|nr:Hsp20/alpha crystallin family protein [Anaerolineaceae bacterium]
MIYRRYSVPSIWQEMDRMQREMNRVASAFAPERGERSRGTVNFPALNAWTDDDVEVITAEMPGVDPKDIEVNVVGDVLTISGKRSPEDPDAEVQYHRRERVCGEFSRSIQLAFPVDSEHVVAGYENGVLRIELPRAEADKPRKISVKTA